MLDAGELDHALGRPMLNAVQHTQMPVEVMRALDHALFKTDVERRRSWTRALHIDTECCTACSDAFGDACGGHARGVEAKSRDNAHGHQLLEQQLAGVGHVHLHYLRGIVTD